MNTQNLTPAVVDSSDYSARLRIAARKLQERNERDLSEIASMMFEVIGAYEYLVCQMRDYREQLDRLQLEQIRSHRTVMMPTFPNQAELAERMAYYRIDDAHEWASTIEM